MNVSKTVIIIASLMIGSSITAVLTRPNEQAMHIGPTLSLVSMVPRQFGDWREELLPATTIVNAEREQLLKQIYSQILTRSYVNADGYRIMLSIAYGNEQRGSLQAHMPEVCYPAQGFKLQSSQAALLTTAYGNIPVQHIFATMGQRQEPITYWFKFGDSTSQDGFQKKLVILRYHLTGEIPDGLLFRISSIDPSQFNAQLIQDQFLNQLLKSTSPADRLRLSGLGGIPGA